MSIKGRRLAILGGATAAATVMLGTPAALAAPPTGPEFAVNCEGLGEFTVVAAPGQADFTPVFTDNQVFIPYQIVGVFTAPGQQPEQFEAVKAAPVPADAISCTFEATFTEDGMTFTVTGTAVVVQRGAPE